MTNSKLTKKALLTSVMALFLCVAMLTGTTFAWFTDTVTSSGNIIKAGTLEVTMEWKDASANGAQQSYKDASEGAIFNYNKWEPGYVEAKNIKIGNAGDLALKYQLNIVATGEVSKLAEVIEVYYAEGELTLTDRSMTGLTPLGTLDKVLANVSSTANGDLLKKGDADIVTIALKMKEEADNTYKGLSIGSEFAVQLMATQLAYEKDSIDDQYDAMATVDNLDEFATALNAGDTVLIELGSDILPTESIVIPEGKTVTVDLMGHKISQERNDMNTAYAMIENKGTLIIKDSIGSGKISFADTTPYTADNNFASNTIRNEGTLTVESGVVENISPETTKNYGYPHAIDAYQGSVTTINGGTVKSLNYDCIRMFCNSETLATKVVINGGTIVNRVSFQDPHSTRPGYGILEINGGDFVTMNGVTANVRLLNFCANCSNMKATVTGGTFDAGFKTQDIGGSGITTSDWLTMGTAVAVTTAAELQAALDNAVDGAVIKFAANITGDVTATQKPDVKVTIDGNNCTLNGTVTVDGKSATYRTAALTIKNVKFVADTVSTAACVNMGVDGNTNTRYICNLTVENCYFNVPGKVAVKSYDNGDKNLKLIGCTVAEGMHSLLQVNNVGEGLLIENCKVYSKNGINTVQSEKVTIIGCEVDVLGYAVRFGASSGGTGYAENYSIQNCTLKSANDDGDATIILRGTADNSTLTITNTTIVGTPDIANTATGATVVK